MTAKLCRTATPYRTRDSSRVPVPISSKIRLCVITRQTCRAAKCQKTRWVDGVAAQAGQADAALRDVVAWARWRLLGWLVAVGAAAAVLGWLMSSGVLWWDTGAIQAARAENARLPAEVAEMQANRDEWAKVGFLAKLGRCDPGNRPCVRVNEWAGAFGTASDYRVLLGY